MIKKPYWIAALFAFLLAALFFIPALAEKSARQNVSHQPSSVFSPRYARNFWVESLNGFRILNVRDAFSEKTAPLQWVLLDSSGKNQEIPENLGSIPRIRVPLERSAILSTTYLGYMKRLGVFEKVFAVNERRHISDSAFFSRIERGEVVEIGSGPSLSVEKLHRSKAKEVFAFATGNSINDDISHLKKWSGSIILTAEWKEKTPLAKAEWLYFFGILYGKEALADRLFKESERAYLKLKNEMEKNHIKEKKSVIAGVPLYGVWHAPEKESYTASLIRDAGGKYLFEQSTGALTFEQALIAGAEADIWVHAGVWKTREEGEKQEPRVIYFKPWRQEAVFQYDLKKGPEGGLDFFESAVVFPERVLQDMIKVLYPELFPEISFEWYRNLSRLKSL